GAAFFFCGIVGRHRLGANAGYSVTHRVCFTRELLRQGGGNSLKSGLGFADHLWLTKPCVVDAKRRAGGGNKHETL
ncbi:MAG: hypothetical protein ABIO35_06690, partial [Nitrobacter sp.]